MLTAEKDGVKLAKTYIPLHGRGQLRRRHAIRRDQRQRQAGSCRRCTWN
ncbi:hypothetical protein ACU4GD_31400 [Cupriavidus basilensis]